jgi:polyisoprenoid-binding protein YceI
MNAGALFHHGKRLIQQRPIVAIAAAAALCTGSLPAHAQVDMSQSSIVATSKQMNVPVDGRFRQFSAQLHFDPAKPAAGTASISIDTASFDLGDDAYNQQARGREWFDSTAYPQATFVSRAIAPAGGERYNVTGQLTIKGHAQTVTVPVTIAQHGATQTFAGALPIRRTQYGVGTGEWQDTSVVADEVIIRFNLVAAQH